MIRLNDVSLVTYEGRVILSDITWHIAPGEHWVIFGRNGSGKTKLIEMIAGYQWQTRGTIARFGEEHGDVREIRKRIGYISSMLKTRFHLADSVRDVVLTGIFASLSLYDEVTAEQIDEAERLLRLVGLDDRRGERFGILSDGEKQKVLIARALIAHPSLILFDEPAMGLDIGSREELLLSIETAARESNVSVVMVTHHTEEITPFFTNALVIENGRIAFSGAPKEMMDDDMLSCLFGRGVRVTPIDGRYYISMQGKG
ncbi:MAG: ATP-binding cassette domain-containing protein [Spirochaetota bacterium]